MQMTPAKPPYGRMLAVFVGTLIAGNAVLWVIGYAFPDFAIANSMGLILLMVSAMAAGQSAAAPLGRRMTAREKLAFAATCTALFFVLVGAVFAGMLVYLGVPVTLQNAVSLLVQDTVREADVWAFLPIFLLVGAALNMLVIYGFVGWGLGSQLKALERKAARGG